MYFRGNRRTVQGERSRRDLGEPVSFSCFTMHVSIYSPCHLCPVGLGKDRPGFVSMELVRGREASTEGHFSFLINQPLPSFGTVVQVWKQLPGERASSQESRAGRKPQEEAVTLMNSLALGDLQVQR